MPLYSFQNENNGEIIEVFQKMNDVHEYHGVDGSENCWRRIFFPTSFTIDGAMSVNPFSSEEFMKATESKKGTIGDIMEASEELSEKRAALAGGTDPIKQKYFDNYAKERSGKRHPKEKITYEDKNVKVDYSGL